MAVWDITQFDKGDETGTTSLVLTYTPAAGHKAIIKQLSVSVKNEEGTTQSITFSVSIGGTVVCNIQFEMVDDQEVHFTANSSSGDLSNTGLNAVIDTGLYNAVAEASEAITITVSSGGNSMTKDGMFSGLDETT